MSGKKGNLRIITCLLVLLSSFHTNAQHLPTTIEWQKCFGWDSWYGDEGVRIVPIQDGNFATIGKKTHQGYETIYASKINGKGEIQWETIIYDDKAYTGFKGTDIVQNADGSFILIGKVVNVQKLSFVATDGRIVSTNTGFKGYYDNLVVKLNNQGQMVWFKLIGGSGEDIPIKILTTPDNNLLLLSYTTSADGDILNSGKNTSSYNRDIWVTKLNQDGNIISKKCIGGNNDDIPWDMKRSSDGSYFVVGSSNSDDSQMGPNKGGKDVMVLKINEGGDVIWKKTYGGNQNEEARRIIQLSNGDLILGIASNSVNNDFQFTVTNDFPNNYQENIWLFKLNGSGDVTNKKLLGGSGRDILNDMILSRDGNCIIIGSTTSNNGNITDRGRIPSNNNDKFDVLLMKTTTNLDFVWEKTIGGSADDEGAGIVENTDETLITIGTTQSFNGDVIGNHYNSQDSRDIWLVKLNYPCEPHITSSEDLVAISTDIVASETVNTSDRIRQHSSIRYSANGSVDLTPGFNSESGSTVEVNLLGCTNGGIGVNANPIQVKVLNECREGGMKFKFLPFTPNTDLSQYRMSIQNLDPSIEFKFSGNTLITKNNIPDNHNAYFLLTVSKNGYEDFIMQGYTSTCEHDGAPIDCPENNSDVILDKAYYQEGETFTATWTGNLLQGQILEWFNENITVISKSGKTLVGRINAFPAHAQAQPGVFPDYRPCHGAVKVEFRKVK